MLIRILKKLEKVYLINRLKMREPKLPRLLKMSPLPSLRKLRQRLPQKRKNKRKNKLSQKGLRELLLKRTAVRKKSQRLRMKQKVQRTMI